MKKWYLEGDFNGDGKCSVHYLESFPVTLGRDAELDLSLVSPSVSRRHAVIEAAVLDGVLSVKDLKSSNGTFVNRQKIVESTTVGHGDVLHFGAVEARLIDESLLTTGVGDVYSADVTTVVRVEDLGLSTHFPAGVAELNALMDQCQLISVFQPIRKRDPRQLVDAEKLKIFGYEALARGTSSKLSPNPSALFHIAESVGLAARLSALMREVAVETAAKQGLSEMLLLNTHPQEQEDEAMLLDALANIRRRYPNMSLMLEIHEKTVSDMAHLKELKLELSRLNIKLAIDDFGVGGANVVELVSAEPDLIKFDRALIEGIDRVDHQRLNTINQLHKIIARHRIDTLAECVCNQGEYLACDSIGFSMYQGFYLGKPLPLGAEAGGEKASPNA
ncbi:MAG: hypothetical protein COA42_08665 [Alteromonadaceae bacterium]|nr:MAG: hypothetical protein COA42_08665 [Alteromonadaceae bacterium]